MNYEQKYKEALARAKDMMSYKEVRREDMEYLFPELKESEDEKIKKQIISFLKEFEHDHYRSLNFSSWIAWLEKQGNNADKVKQQQDIEIPFGAKDSELQEATYYISEGYYAEINGNAVIIKKGEQKPVDKVEPKFKVGDWVVWKDKCYKVNYNGCGYELVDQNGLSTSLEYGTIDENAHLWTIEDAKDGDVLAAHECLVLFKEIDWLNIRCYCSLYMGFNPSFSVDTLQNKDAFHPATKEQRDLLFQRIKDEGYEWNADEKVLNKVIIYE